MKVAGNHDASLKRLESINTDTRLTVFGYLRQNENKMALFCNISSIISYLCLSYYYHGKYFETAGNDLQTSNDKMAITKVSNNKNLNNTAYGKTWIDSSIDQIVEWKFKFNKSTFAWNARREIYICLVSTDNRLNEDCNKSDDGPNFGFSNYGYMKIDGAEDSVSDGPDVFPHSKISMILNTKERAIYLRYHAGTIKRGDDIKYKMAISILQPSDSIFYLILNVSYYKCAQ